MSSPRRPESREPLRFDTFSTLCQTARVVCRVVPSLDPLPTSKVVSFLEKTIAPGGACIRSECRIGRSHDSAVIRMVQIELGSSIDQFPTSRINLLCSCQDQLAGMFPTPWAVGSVRECTPLGVPFIGKHVPNEC